MLNEDIWKTHIQKNARIGRKKYLDLHTVEKENAILQIILVYAMNGGISHNQLAQISDLDRKSLRKYTKKLWQEGKIRKDGKGRHGKYFPTEEAYKDPLLNAMLFGDDFRFRLLDKKEGLVLCNQMITDFDLKREINCSRYTSFYNPMFTSKYKAEEALFEFSNRVGAFITYALIQAMNPDNNKTSLSARVQDEIVKKWAQNSISRILPFLVKYFNDFVYRAIDQYPRGYDEQVKFINKSPRFILDKSISSKSSNNAKNSSGRNKHESSSNANKRNGIDRPGKNSSGSNKHGSNSDESKKHASNSSGTSYGDRTKSVTDQPKSSQHTVLRQVLRR